MEIAVVHILFSLVVHLLQYLTFELTELHNKPLIAILIRLTFSLNEIIHPIKHCKLKLVQTSKLRSDQSERVVPSLDKRDSPESGEYIEFIIVQVDEFQSFAQIDLTKR